LASVGRPGDFVHVSGVFLPKNEKGELLGSFMEAHQIVVCNQNEIDSMPIMDDEIAHLSTCDFYEKMAASLAPEIYGNLDLKKVLLLQLVGGVDNTKKGLKIRGNIHICIVGDPGVAKSQLLSFVCRVAANSQYITGRGSSVAGLTAAVVKDPLTGELVLESGALALADGSICCIDEFDKMRETDQTAIHEVMEQQTISIAKAGIVASLDARTSLLAVLNPRDGSYNSKRSIEQNINLSPALLSRFDIIWLIRDRPNYENDLRIANHITYVHQHGRQPQSTTEVYDIRLMRQYIALCKRVDPTIPEDLSPLIIEAYGKLRREDAMFTSARKIVDIIRLSTARARLRLSTVVDETDIVEVLRLMGMAADSIREPIPKHKTSKLDRIYKMICELVGDKKNVKVSDIFSRCSSNFTRNEILECIEEYERLDVWFVNQSQTELQICW